MKFLNRYVCVILAAALTSSCLDNSVAPEPKPGGQIETAVVRDLDSCTQYYFALQASDEASNGSGMSNCANGSTLSETIPPAVVLDVAARAIDETPFELTWTAPGDDGDPGMDSTYEIRYSTELIDDDLSWSGLAIPAHPGQGGYVSSGAVKQAFRNSGSYIQRTIPGSSGKVVLNQPAGAVTVTLTGIVTGLEPSTEYYAYLWAGEASYGPYWHGSVYPLKSHYQPSRTSGVASWWDGSVWYGTFFRFAQFTTDTDGAASFHLNIFSDEIDAGDYKLSVFVDGVSSGARADTYLIADPIPVVVD